DRGHAVAGGDGVPARPAAPRARPRRQPTDMTELRNVEADLAHFRTRVIVIALAVLFAFGLVVARMVWLQVVQHEAYVAQAESNRTAVLPVVPNRGRITDRHGRVLATNYSAYTLEITPSQVD